MKLLIITQKVDENDDILGFFHRWIEEFAKHCEHVTVICLYKGEYHLPDNVKVLSLGKEEGVSRLTYLVRFYRYIWNERKNYDNVFVHMNQEYVLLGGIFWRLLKKRSALWYNHTVGTFETRLAGRIVNIAFHTSPYAYTAQFPNARRMPAGIDTKYFKSDEKITRTPYSILYIGRIDPVKNVDVLIKAVKILDEKGVSFTLNIYGGATPEDEDYFNTVKELSSEISMKGKVVFHDATPNYKTPAIYSAHEIFVNLTPAGNYDKTVLEALACETAVLVSSKAFFDVLPKDYQFNENDSQDLADGLQKLLENPTKRKKYQKDMRDYVVARHDLQNLTQKVIREYSK